MCVISNTEIENGPTSKASPRPTVRNEYASRSTSLPSSDTNRLTESTNPSGE